MPDSDKIMTGSAMKPLLALSKKDQVSAAVALTAAGEGLILLSKLTLKQPKQLAAVLKSTAEKEKIKLNMSTLRFGRAEVDADYDAGMVRFWVNKEAPGAMRAKLVPVVKGANYQKVELNIDPSLEEEADVAELAAPPPAPTAFDLATELRALHDQIKPLEDGVTKQNLMGLVQQTGASIKSGDLAAATQGIANIEEALRAVPRAKTLSDQFTPLIRRLPEITEKASRESLAAAAQLIRNNLRAIVADGTAGAQVDQLAEQIEKFRTAVGNQIEKASGDRGGVGIGEVTPDLRDATTTEQINTAVSKRLDTLAAMSSADQAGAANRMTNEVAQADPALLAAEPPWRGALRLATLTTQTTRDSTGRWATPPAQMEALKKLYRVMKPDPAFETDDRQKRDNVLRGLQADPTANRMRDGWGTTYRAVSEADLRTLQTQVVDHRAPGMLDPMRDRLSFDRSPAMGSSAGQCSGKQVRVNPDQLSTFDDTLDTVVHETTHAYQKHLEEQIDSGALGTADPRYVQAQIFKFNNKGYFKLGPKPRPGASQAEQDRYNEEYQIYHDQPVEMHAHKAGNEAGRLFNVRSARVRLANARADIGRFLPGRDAALAGIEQRFGGAPTAAIAALAELDAITTEAVTAANDAVSTLLATPGLSGYLDQRYVQPGEWNNLSRQRQTAFTASTGNPAGSLSDLANLHDQINAHVTAQAQAGAQADRQRQELQQLTEETGTLLGTANLSAYLDRTYSPRGYWDRLRDQRRTYHQNSARDLAGSLRSMRTLAERLRQLVQEFQASGTA
jgi:hypothetical protein